MKHDVFSMITRANHVFSGNDRHPQDPYKLAPMSESHIKIMLIAFFDIKGTVHSEFIPQGQSVNKACYMEILKRGVGKGLNSGPTIGFSTTLMVQLTRRCLLSSFWSKKRLLTHIYRSLCFSFAHSGMYGLHFTVSNSMKQSPY
jgi:hypothetical protein